MKKVVYTAHSSDSMKFVEWIQLYCFERGVIPVNPFACFGYYIHYKGAKNDENQSISDDIELMLRCDELWVFGEITSGIQDEIDAWQSEYPERGIGYVGWDELIPESVLAHYRQNKDNSGSD